MGELRFTAQEPQASRDGIDVASLELDGADLEAMDVLRTGAGMDLLARLDRGRGLGNASRDAFAGSAGAIVLRASAVDRAALVDAGGGSCACGSRRRATGWGSIRRGRRSSSSACSRTATRWRGGSGPR